MTYLQASNRPGKERARRVVMVCGVVIVILGGIQFFVPHFLPSIFTTIARPFWRVEFSISEGALKSPESLLNENVDLKRQLEDAKIDLQSIQDLADQNAEFLVLLGRKDLTATTTVIVTSTASTSATTTKTTQSSKTKTVKASDVGSKILAAVLKRPPYAVYDELVIDIGSDHGLKIDDPVYVDSNLLIGRVSDVLSNTAKVVLYSSPGQSYPVLIGSTHISATATGAGGGQYTAKVPQAAVISIGDSVSDSSISTTPFGFVTSVIVNPADPFQTVLFAPPVNIFDIRWVLVQPQSSSVKN